jgi:hypothetical protein
MTTQKIHQLQVAYSQTEDRLLLRFNTTDGTEFRFWLTRLFIKKFWPGLVNTLEAKSGGGMAQDPGTKESVMGFMHQAAVEKADFSTKFETKKAPCPLGENPILVCRAQIQVKNPEALLLSLYPEKGYGVELGVDQNLLHLLGKLIRDAVAKIDWSLAISLPGSGPEEGFTLTEDGKKARSLH